MLLFSIQTSTNQLESIPTEIEPFITILVTAHNEELVIGGRVFEAGEVFLKPLKSALDKYTFPQISGQFQFRKAALGNDAGVYGAAYQIVHHVRDHAI